ncbi:MAG: anhydro-N-acetylmuramic acid kinase [Halioglobus sp.]
MQTEPVTGALYVGLMSGTSVDAIDSALVRCDGDTVELLATHLHPIPPQTREAVAALCNSGPGEIERMGLLDRELGSLFADATLDLLLRTGQTPTDIRAIGSHGQTIRHRPPSGGAAVDKSFTLQIGDPNTIAERTGVTTVADFRRRDVAAGGEGAPLAPAFHAAALSREGVDRAIVNIGGIANVTLLRGRTLYAGFDTGPGNTLLDQWVRRHRGESHDRNGQWSAEGAVVPALLECLLEHPYFDLTGPRSTGREVFNLPWLEECLHSLPGASPRDVQATLAELTATSIARAIAGSDLRVTEAYVCGGGAHNTDLMRRLYRKLAPASLSSTAVIGIDPDWVEAATFAWLAHRTLEGLAGNLPAVTGARGPRILGGVYAGGDPAPSPQGSARGASD